MAVADSNGNTVWTIRMTIPETLNLVLETEGMSIVTTNDEHSPALVLENHLQGSIQVRISYQSTHDWPDQEFEIPGHKEIAPEHFHHTAGLLSLSGSFLTITVELSFDFQGEEVKLPPQMTIRITPPKQG